MMSKEGKEEKVIQISDTMTKRGYLGIGIAIVILTILLAVPFFVFGQLTNEETKEGISVKLLNNTDFCETDCFSIYRICSNSTTKTSDITFKFSNEKEQLKDSSLLKSVPIIDIKTDKNCYDIRIDGKKGIFDNIDNVPCLKDICFNKFAWWNTTYIYRFNIDDGNITNYESIFYIDSQWIKKANYVKYKYCDWLNCSNLVAYGNETDRIPIENETSKTYYLDVWDGIANDVFHLIDLTGHNSITRTNTISDLTGTTTLVTGQFGNARKTNGINNCFGDTSYTGNIENRTVLMMYRKDSNTSLSYDRVVWIYDDSGNGQNGCGLVSDISNLNKFTITCWGQAEYSDVEVINHGQWYCLAWKKNVTSFSLYKNGTYITKTPYSYSFAVNSWLSFGCHHWSADYRNYANGSYDDIRVYNRELSDSEIMDYCNSNFVTLNTSPENLTVINFQFNFRDSFTNTELDNLLLYCDTFSETGDSPLYHVFTNLTETIYCNVSTLGYFNKTFNFQPSETSKIVFLDRQGLTEQEHQWLKTTMFLQSVQGMDIYPTNKTCVGANTLKQEYKQEICIDSSCNNFTVKQETIPCFFGCVTEINKFSAECKEPDWLIYVIIIIIVIGIFTLIGYLWKK